MSDRMLEGALRMTRKLCALRIEPAMQDTLTAFGPTSHHRSDAASRLQSTCARSLITPSQGRSG